MNKREKEVQQAFLNSEKKVLKDLEANYKDALIEINAKLEVLMARQDADMTHVIYQVEHQRALKTQVQSILENLQTNEFETISEYLANSYTDGFIGAMYDIHGQGIPIIAKIDQKAVVAAIQHETKLTSKLYSELGLDIKDLQKKIAGEISRGISTGKGYPEIARNIEFFAKIPKNRAMTIARTESHRIQCKATSDAQFKAKEKGADVVKQWDAALDGDTRPNHRKLDGQIRELEERFEVGKFKPRFPGDFGTAGEDCNCRCALLQRARWALNEAELEKLKKRAEYFELDKTKDFEDYKKKYLKASEKESVRSSAQKMNPVNKNGEEIQFDFKGKDEKHEKQKQIITDLSNEYDTRLQKVTTGAEKGAGSTDMSGATIRLNDTNVHTAIHEFAHSLANTSADKYGLTHDSDFWNEIKKIRSTYRKDVGDDVSKWISSYEHGETQNPLDEFLAEAFTQAKMNQLGLEIPSKYGSDFTYSNQVLELVDKYFKKETLENIGKSGIIKVDKVIQGHESTPKKAKPNSVIDHINSAGLTDARGFYGDDGMKQKDLHTNNHGNPKRHDFGVHGEHGHDYEWNDDGSLKNKTTRELSEKEREENGDIL